MNDRGVFLRGTYIMQASTLHTKERFDVNLDALYGIGGKV